MRKGENKHYIDTEYLDMMLYNFKYAIEHNMDFIYMGYTILDDDNLKEYWIKKKDWIKTCDLLIQGAIEIEEYEFCKELKQIKESLI